VTVIGPDFVKSGVRGRNNVQGVSGPEEHLLGQGPDGKLHLPENPSCNWYQKPGFIPQVLLELINGLPGPFGY